MSKDKRNLWQHLEDKEATKAVEQLDRWEQLAGFIEMPWSRLLTIVPQSLGATEASALGR